MATSRASKLSGSARSPASPEFFGNVGRKVLLTAPNGSAAEAIRALRTRVQSQHLQLGRRALSICGPTPEVGATFIAVNLAIALSQIGNKTLLVDGDLRNPNVSSYFSSPLTRGGLVECLRSGADSAAEFIDDNVLPNLDVLSAGNPESNAHELLAGEGFSEVIDTCIRDYDITIIDTPPANSCSDGLRISTLTGFALIVARKNRTLVSDVRILAGDLKKERAQPIGTVLNSF